MRNTMVKLVLLTTLGLGVFAKGEESAKIVWPAGKSAVAWVTKKRMFVFQNVEPMGLNSSVRVTLNESQKTVSIQIPINKFDSGEPDRDTEVVKILKGDAQPDLLFTSDPISEDLQKNILQDHSVGRLGGKLQIGGKAFPVSFEVKKGKEGQLEFLDGELRTTFTAFDIEPPSVAGGLVAKVKDELTLRFRIFLGDIHKE